MVMIAVICTAALCYQKVSSVGAAVMFDWAVDRCLSSADRSRREQALQLKADSLVRHEICGGCRLEKIKGDVTGETCGQWMAEVARLRNTTLSEAGRLAAKRFPGDCNRCDPSSCAYHDRDYWDPDVASPRILASRTIKLESIPKEYRIPEEALDDLGSFFSKPENQHPYLWEWNPATVLIPQEHVPIRHAWAKRKDFPVYISTFRVSKLQNCFRNDFEHIQHIGNDNPSFKETFVDLVGIALLREDFSIVDEGVFDFRSVIGKNQDVRLFVFPPEEGSTEMRLYLSSRHLIARFWLNASVAMNENTETNDKRMFLDVFRKEENPLSIVLEENALYCTATTGKNFNYFVDNNKQIMVETLPMAPHIVEHIDFAQDCNANEGNNAFKSTSVREPYVPKKSFPNTDEVYFLGKSVYELPYSSQHGTTCCVRMPDPRKEGNELLVGISHTKSVVTSKLKTKIKSEEFVPRQYTSHFYAFEPRFPYRIVAFSGGFCLTNPTVDDVKDNSYTEIVLQRPFMLGGRELNCPFITFLSGISDKAGDPSRAIISYGLNDCTARVVEVSKEEISLMLFDPLSRLEDLP